MADGLLALFGKQAAAIRRSVMRIVSIAFALASTLIATEASAQFVNLTGPYQCVQGCQPGPTGPAFITQNGWDMNVTNEFGETSHGWIDYNGHIWLQNWNEGAVYSSDGLTIQFDRGIVWQRDFGPPPPPPPGAYYRRPPPRPAPTHAAPPR
jgi:hypothetical protein